MTTQRANYLRRAIPRLREQYKPRYVVTFPNAVTSEQKKKFKEAMDRAFAGIRIPRNLL